MGGFVVGQSGSDLSQMIFKREAELTAKSEQFGMGKEQYQQLEQSQRDWETQRDGGRPYAKISPMVQKQMEIDALRTKLGQNPVEFKSLLKAESAWQNKVEASKFDDSVSFSKTSPLAEALMKREGTVPVQQFEGMVPKGS